jgi:hypothetical protein
MNNKLKFNYWSQERIKQGRKICTSRESKHLDDSVWLILELPLKIVRDYLWKQEGADSPEEFENVWRDIKGSFEEDKIVFVHFFR